MKRTIGVAKLMERTMQRIDKRREGRPVRNRVRFDKEDCFLCLYPHGPDGEMYDINLKAFKSGTDFFVWLEHLREKKWFDAAFEREFTTVFLEAWHDTFNQLHFTGRDWNWDAGTTG